MSTFRDEEILIEPTKKTPRPHLAYITVDLSAQDCQLYGHSWQTVGTAGAKCCTQCGMIGYCPGCISHIPEGAQPFFCTKHTPRQASFSPMVTQEAVIEALSRAATHWYEAARALVEYAGQPPTSERNAPGESPELDLETLISYTLSQRVRVWAIAHSLLAEQMQQLFPTREQEGGQAQQPELCTHPSCAFY